MAEVNRRIFPEDPNSKKMPIQKGDQRPVNEDPDATKNPSLHLGHTKTTRINVNNMLTGLTPQPQNLFSEPTEVHINDDVTPNPPPPDCVIPPKYPDDVSPLGGGVTAERTNILENINTPKVVDIIDVNDNDIKPNEDNEIFYGTVNEVLTLVDEMKDELEKEGYSISAILNSSFLINVLDSAQEGMPKGQVKQIIIEELAKMPYDQVCNLTDVVANVIQAAGVQNLEAETGLSLIALINIVVDKALEAGSDKKPVTLSGIKQIIDEVLFSRSQRYKESIYSDDNAALRADTDVKDFIRYICSSFGYNVNDEMMDNIYISVIRALSEGEITLIPNVGMISDVISMLLNKDIPGISIDTVTKLIDIMLKGQVNGTKSEMTYGALKAFILNILENMANDCVLPPVDPPVGPMVNPNIEHSANNFDKADNIKIDERHL